MKKIIVLFCFISALFSSSSFAAGADTVKACSQLSSSSTVGFASADEQLKCVESGASVATIHACGKAGFDYAFQTNQCIATKASPEQVSACNQLRSSSAVGFLDADEQLKCIGSGASVATIRACSKAGFDYAFQTNQCIATKASPTIIQACGKAKVVNNSDYVNACIMATNQNSAVSLISPTLSDAKVSSTNEKGDADSTSNSINGLHEAVAGSAI